MVHPEAKATEDKIEEDLQQKERKRVGQQSIPERQ